MVLCEIELTSGGDAAAAKFQLGAVVETYVYTGQRAGANLPLLTAVSGDVVHNIGKESIRPCEKQLGKV